MFWALLGLAVSGALVGVARYLAGKRGYGLYCGTVARSLVPVFAAAAIVLGIVAAPVLERSETRFVRAGNALSADAETLSFTRLEALVVQRLKARIAEAAARIEQGS